MLLGVKGLVKCESSIGTQSNSISHSIKQNKSRKWMIVQMFALSCSLFFIFVPPRIQIIQHKTCFLIHNMSQTFCHCHSHLAAFIGYMAWHWLILADGNCSSHFLLNLFSCSQRKIKKEKKQTDRLNCYQLLDSGVWSRISIHPTILYTCFSCARGGVGVLPEPIPAVKENLES